ncbi:MAG: trypsin-like peptidase domain-containing protein [Planctomycetota bacterium]
MRRVIACFSLWLFTGFATAQHADERAALEQDIIAAIAHAQDATVAIHLGGGTGSGVIVSPDGLILSVAHVTGSPGQRAAVYFADGSVAVAETLGLEPGTDCGMLRLLGGGPWPFLALATHEHDQRENEDAQDPEDATRRVGGPVIALGHPGGFDPTRPVVARFGTTLDIDPRDATLRTDAVLTAGDSGGPLLNRAGRVIAIHARVGPSLDANYHIAIERFLEQWSRLLEGGTPIASLGAVGRDALAGFAVGGVEPNSAADRAGLTRGDLILGFNGVAIGRPPDGRSLRSFLALRRPGDVVELHVKRRGQTMKLTVTLDEPE